MLEYVFMKANILEKYNNVNTYILSIIFHAYQFIQFLSSDFTFKINMKSDFKLNSHHIDKSIIKKKELDSN